MLQTTRTLTLTAIFISLITLLSLVPMQFGPINLIVLLFVPLMVGCQTQGLIISMILGLYTGLLSLVSSYTVSTSLLRFVFNNPLVSVLPRIIVGIITNLSFRFFNKILSKKLTLKSNTVISSGISSFLGVLTNTTLVLGLMFGLYNGTNYSGIVINETFIWSIVISNSIAEIVVTTIITPQIVYALTRLFNKKNCQTKSL